MITTLALTLVPLTSCTGDDPTGVALDTGPAAAVVEADAVTDLTVTDATTSTLTVTWTQVDDGTGAPAWYRVKYATPTIDWSTATIGCDRTLKGDEIGAPMSCTIEGLHDDTPYEVQLMSYGTQGGKWKGATYSNIASGRTMSSTASTADAEPVTDLAVMATTESSLTVGWTQVDDGTGEPARYRVKYATPPIDWSTATTACTLTGDQIGEPLSCGIPELAAETTYDVQLMSYRVEDGVWQGAVYSNVAAGQTDAESGGATASDGMGIWIGASEIAALPTSGSAWNELLSDANQSCGTVDLANQDQDNNVCVMAKALVYARTGDAGYATDVIAALTQLVTASTYDGRALALGRELGAYVIAADLVGLESLDPTLDVAFRSTIRELLTTYTHSGPDNLVECHEIRPNNWGTHCGGARAAVAAYLGDTAELDRVAQVFKGWLGDRSSYAGFNYGDLSWQCDSSRPVGINPAGCTRDGHSIDGVLPDDQRRAGSFSWPPSKENYVWEGLQGALMQAVILERAGYPAFEWENRALLRAVRWLHQEASYPAEGDDTWQPHVVNRYYGTSFPAPTPSRPGKNVGYTDWTHR